MISLTSDIRTPYHAWPAGPKLLGLSGFTLAIFYMDGVALSAAVVAAVCAAYLPGGLRFARQGARLMRPVFWFVAVIMIWHLAVGRTTEGAVVVLRLIAAIAAANLVTLTTRLEDMLDVIQRGLARLGVSQRTRRKLALSVALVIRFTPVLTQKGGLLVQAWRARTVKRPGWRLVLPFALLAIDDAEHTAEALKARGGLH